MTFGSIYNFISRKWIFKFSVCSYLILSMLMNVSCDNDITLELTTDQPAVLGAPIGFFAKLIGTADPNATYDYEWSSKGAGYKNKTLNQSTSCNITITVLKNGTFEMKLNVYSGLAKLAKASLSFTITETINGLVHILQPGIYNRTSDVVSTQIEATLSFQLHDPYNFFNNSVMLYYWSFNGQSPESFESSFKYNFSSPGVNNLVLMVTAIPTMSRRPYFNSFTRTLKARDPIHMLNVSGEMSIQHGDLLELEVSCEGSSPFSYCWYFTTRSTNHSNEKCLDPIITTSCDFYIIRYLKKSGNYKLVAIIDNDVDHKVNVYNINVYANVPEPQLSPIIVPLVCSSLALVIVVVGTTYYIQSRRNYSVEVADFDFQQTENFEFHTFYERLRNACKELCGDHFGGQEQTYTYTRIPAEVT